MAARVTYTFSHYYGNFDQDSTTTANDANVFIGSSFIADAAGRQFWDDHNAGDLRGDRRHMFKMYGAYTLDFVAGKFHWDATVGAFLVAQSGQPWEAWSYEPYRALSDLRPVDTFQGSPSLPAPGSPRRTTRSI